MDYGPPSHVVTTRQGAVYSAAAALTTRMFRPFFATSDVFAVRSPHFSSALNAILLIAKAAMKIAATSIFDP
jgi:hypothetical protein